MFPIIISAPHAQSKISDKKNRNRIKLSKYEIWKCSDPYTNELKEFKCAHYKQIAKIHRLICDFNRPPDERAFHKKDFFGRTVFKKGKTFTKKEQKELLEEYWIPYHLELEEKIRKLDAKSKRPLLLIEYHNTSGDHPLTISRSYMPGIVISNLGQTDTGHKRMLGPNISLPAEQLKFLQAEIKKDLHIPVEVNEIYHGGYNTLWLSQLENLKNKIYVVQIEYNLDFIANPISKHVDKKALLLMQKALNKAIVALYQNLPK